MIPFVAMDLVGFSVGGSGSVLAGLRTQFGTKKKVCIESIYFCGPSYKKSKKSNVAGSMINLSAELLPVDVLQAVYGKCKVSWSSKVKNKKTSVSEISNVENINNMIAEKMNYIDSNASETDNIVDNATSKKMHTRMFVLSKLLKMLFFKNLSNNNAKIVLLVSKFLESHNLLLAESWNKKVRNFNFAKSFALDIELLAISRKTNSNKLFLSFTSEFSLNKTKSLVISEKILVNSDIKKVNSCLNWELIIKKIPVNFPKSAVKSVFSKFGKIISIKMQLIGLWQKTLVEFKSLDMTNSALLYTLLVGTTAHNLSDLLKLYGRKTCFIGCNLILYVYNRCAIVCFVDETFKLAVIDSILVFKSVNLYWTGLSLIAGSASFYVVSLVFFGVDLSSGAKPILIVFGLLVTSVSLVSDFDSNMILNNVLALSASSFSVVVDVVADFSSSSFKVLTTKMGNLELKIVALKGFFGAEVVIIMNNSLAHHVSKMEKIPGRVILVWLLFKGKLSVMVLGVYAGVSSETRFKQTLAVNFFIAKAVNSSTFVVLGGDFNESRFGKSASFRFCLNLDLVNSFSDHYLANASIWSNSREVKRTIDYIFVSKNLSSAVIGHKLGSVAGFFNTDYKAVIVFIGLSRLLDVHLNSLCK
ncbi:hypothetical protein G9A89_012721 [Geosiphon pyriformis]|nr:hypothetical protein G9A89_012721 [Geosiphon pyriformis]